MVEHRVETTKGSGRVDFALQDQGHTVAHIEAKAPGLDLDRYAKQAVGYGFDEGVYICALTSGLEWQLYLPRANRPPKERLFATLHLVHDRVDQLAEDLETFLGKESLRSGSSERRATEVLEARRQADILKTKLPEIWSRMKREPDQRLVDLVVDRAYEELNLRPAPEQVRAVLRESPVPTVAPRKPAGARGGNDDVLPARGSQGEVSDLERRIVDRYLAWNSRKDRSRENSSRLNSLLHSWFEIAEDDRHMTVKQMADIVGKIPATLRERAGRSAEARAAAAAGEVTRRRQTVFAYRLWGQRYEVNTWAAMLVGVAEALHQRHGTSFDRILTLRGQTRLYASRNREDISYNPKLVGTSGIYIETHGNKADKMRRAGQFLEFFGHSPDDLRIEEGL
ncbi:MAG: hypothetical protein F4176_01280 [Acidimicrobiia bacterium]|nr:hypothetical protein [Acidimicrobiia bacterium]